METFKQIQAYLNDGKVKESLDYLVEVSRNSSDEIRDNLIQIISEYSSLPNADSTNNDNYVDQIDQVKVKILEISNKADKEIRALQSTHSNLIRRIELIIAINKRTILRYGTLSFIIILIGLSIIFTASLGNIFEDTTFKTVLSIGGALVSTISGFPIKIINEKFNGISICKDFRNYLLKINNNDIIAHKDYIYKIQTLLWEKSHKIFLN